MTTTTVTLALDGRPTIDEYAAALTSWRQLLEAITDQVAHGTQVQWVIDGLEVSSAITTALGESADDDATLRVADTYLAVGRQMETGQLEPSYERPAGRILRLISDRIPSIRFETAEDDVTIGQQGKTLGQVLDFANRLVEPTLGGIEGRIQTVTTRGGLRFTLYDLVHDKAVSCYLVPGQEELLRDAWGRLAIVEGRVKRDQATGRPTTVRNVTRVDVRSEVNAGEWRQARAALAGVATEPAEATIRKIRDDW